MTNPQDPQQPSGDSPQDPGNPQNPYGEPPATQPPAQPPQYGQPQYGQPQVGQPQYGQPQPGQPYPAGATNQQPSRGLAIASLLLSLIACTIIAGIASIVLAIMVLLKGKDGRDHGKGFAIAGLIISTLSILAMVGLIAFGVVLSNSIKDVNELKTGDCVNIKGFEGEEFESLESVECAEKHDAEVLTTIKLSADEASAYPDTGGSDLCNNALPIEDRPTAENLEFLFLTDLAKPETGDTVACMVRAADGSKLTGKVE